jgi:hypothetical protein
MNGYLHYLSPLLFWLGAWFVVAALALVFNRGCHLSKEA